MSQLLAQSLPTDPVSRLRRWLAENPERRSIQIGILATLLVHLLVFIFAPRMLTTPVHSAAMTHAKPLKIKINLAPKAPAVRQQPKPQPRFVEANPNAPENIPDKTNNIANRNQQVAQEKPTPNGKSDMPAIDGRKDIQNPTQIVDGQLVKPQEAVPTPTVAQPPRAPSAAVQKTEQNPLAGFEKDQSDKLDAAGTNVGKVSNNNPLTPDKVDGAKNPQVAQNATSATPQIDPLHPQPRRTLTVPVRQAVLAENRFGTQNVGLVGFDARWSNYGVYLQRLIDTVQTEWEGIVDASRLYPPAGTTVEVKFVLDSKGRISRIVKVTPSVGTPDFAQSNCVSGITARAPYGDWTDDMISVFGTEQELTFRFLYE